MALPDNIQREHLLKAIEKIDKEGIPLDGDSQYYDVIYKGKKYPPKVIVSYANLFANGSILDRKLFSGGEGTTCFKLLKENKFTIKEKMTNGNVSYFTELEKFLAQAETDNLKKSDYIKKYQGLSVKVGFGNGNIARIPWIAFLKDENTVQKGIYPGFLYYKKFKLLILAYCISETHKPLIKWNITNAKTIDQYFSENQLARPERYGNSIVSKVFDISNPLNREDIDSSLSNMFSMYYAALGNHQPESLDKFRYTEFNLELIKSGLFFNNIICLRYISSLLTKPFVILTGLSGSGKTKLAQAFAMWMCEKKNQYCIVPVGADWTNREPILGYPNALKPGEYVKPDSGVLDLIIQANSNPRLPHFLILDEMNLSHVERYFADFLSVMESKEEISLFAESTVENGIPSKIWLSPNLFIIGTVNVDETTNMFSPKVLDRANTIEFRINDTEMQAFLDNISEIKMDALKSKGAGMARSFLQLSENKSVTTLESKEINETLVRFFGQLKKTGAEFGYRTATEILRLIYQLTLLDSTLTTNQKLDIAIIQKLLPKLHGSRRKLCPVLITLGSFCIDGDQKMEKDVFENENFNFNGANVRYPLSLEKIARIYKGATDNGFASFAEA